MTTTTDLRNTMTAQIDKFNEINPLIKQVVKDGLTLELRKYGYFILLSNGKVTKQGIRLSNELKQYFEI